jgi:hypothetical protein
MVVSSNVRIDSLTIDGFGDPQFTDFDGVGEVTGRAPGNTIAGPDGKYFVDTDIVDPYRTFLITTLSGDGRSLISSDDDGLGRGLFKSAPDTTSTFSASYTSGAPDSSGNGNPFSLLPCGADPDNYSLFMGDIVVDPGEYEFVLVEFELRSLASPRDSDDDPEVAIEIHFHQKMTRILI